MTTRFITYVPKPTKTKDSSKPLCKSSLKELSTSDNNQLPTQNPLPVKVSDMEGDFLTQKANGNDEVMAQVPLPEICKSSNNGDDDEDDTYFPTVQELIARRGGGHAPKAVDKPALDDGDRSINSDEFILGPNSGNSQDNPVCIREDKQNDIGSKADLNDFHIKSTKSTAGCSESRQTSLDTTISSSSKPQNPEVDCKASKAAEMCKRARGSLKRKRRSIWGEDLDDLSESQDSSMDSDSDNSDSDDGSETKSEFDGRLAQKQKTNNSQHSRKESSTSSVQIARTVQDKLPAADDTESRYAKSCQYPFDGQDPYDGAIKLLATVCGNELEHNDAMDSRPKEDTNILSAPRPATAAVIYQELVMAMNGQSAPLARSPSTILAIYGPEMLEQAVEVANDKQEWEICDIIGKEDVDGVLHYWVQWSATLVPKCEMGKARALIARFEAGLRAQHKQRKQKGGKGRGRPFPSRAGKQARTRAKKG